MEVFWIVASGLIGGGVGGAVTQALLRKAKRDLFAAHALSGMLANGVPPDHGFVELAYAFADLMIKERAKA